MVWADPRSLAATEGVDVSFSSWGYLDVSVVPVPSCNLCIQLQVFRYNPEGVSAFGNLRIVTCLAIPRSLSQPCYVLHRSPAPDHPPHALNVLTTEFGLSSETLIVADTTLTLFVLAIQISKNTINAGRFGPGIPEIRFG